MTAWCGFCENISKVSNSVASIFWSSPTLTCLIVDVKFAEVVVESRLVAALLDFVAAEAEGRVVRHPIPFSSVN